MVVYKIQKIGRYGKISPLPQGTLSNTLDKYLSYQKQGAQYMPNPQWAIVHLYKQTKGAFPWGLLKTVESVLKKWNELKGDSYILEVDDIGIIDKDKFLEVSKDMRYYQKEALMALIINNGGILSIPTGAGKTFIGVQFMKYMEQKSLVVVHTLDLKSQWQKQVPNYVDVKTYQSIKDPGILKDYKVVVLDEVHLAPCKSIYSVAIKCDNSIMVGLSATPWREDGNDMKIHAACGDIVYNIDKKKLIAEKFLSNATCYYLKYDNHCKDKFTSYPDIYKNYIVHNDQRNKKIIEVVEKYPNRKILILVVQVEHGTLLNGMIKDSLFLHGKIKDRSIPEDKNIIIATSIFDLGVDLPMFDILILGSGGKSSVRLTQRVGRILRAMKDKHALVFDFIDKSRYLSKHYAKRRKLLEEDFEVIDYDK